MPIPAYMWLKDETGADIKGSVDVAGREGSVEVLEFHHEVRIPTDPDTGKLTGTRKHESLTIVKAYDASSPYLYKAVCEGQTFQSVELKWFNMMALNAPPLHSKVLHCPAFFAFAPVPAEDGGFFSPIGHGR